MRFESLVGVGLVAVLACGLAPAWADDSGDNGADMYRNCLDKAAASLSVDASDIDTLGQAIGSFADKSDATKFAKSFDACLGVADGAKLGADEFVAPDPPARPGVGEPNLEPTIKLESERFLPTDAIAAGLRTSFASYGKDDAAKKVLSDGAPCVAEAVSSSGSGLEGSGFSEKARAFMASGPAVGSGDYGSFLPDAKDKDLWSSDNFQSTLASCIAGARGGGGTKAKR